MKLIHLILFVCLSSLAFGQTTQTPTKLDPREVERILKQAQSRENALKNAEREGMEVRIKEIARFRGIRSNQLLGVGLVVGLNGTGDTKNTPYSQTLLANAMKEFGASAEAALLKTKNVAVVFVTADLPPFAAPGNAIDVTVQSMGDAKSLQGGSLLRTPLFAAGSQDKAYVVCQGAVSIGGFQAASGGNSAQKNHPTVGRSPGIVEASVPTKTVFDGRMFLELDEADLTTAKRIAGTIAQLHPEYMPFAIDAGTIQLVVPDNKGAVEAMSEIEQVRVFSDTLGVIVIDERTGTVVIGANVRIGPAVVAKGGLSVRIVQTPLVSQPSPFSLGSTVTATQTDLNVTEDPAQIAMIGPNATVADLATIFQLLKVAPSDIIAILEDLKAQGALKAKIKRL